MVPVKPKAGELLEPKLQPDGSVTWQQFVKVIGPIDIRAIACGDNVSDLIIAPWPSGMSSWSDLTGIPKNCIGKQANQAPSGVWVIQARTKTKTGKLSIRAAAGDFASPLP